MESSSERGAACPPELLNKARARDAEALAGLCALYYPRILRFMRYRMGPQDADDLTSEVFVKVMRAIDHQTGRFEPWLYRLARNVIIDRVRYRQARPETEFDDVVQQLPANETPSREATAARVDIENALTLVSEDHRELLTLKFVQGLSNQEISEITGQNLNAIRVMQFRALKAMRAVLEQKGATP